MPRLTRPQKLARFRSLCDQVAEEVRAALLAGKRVDFEASQVPVPADPVGGFMRYVGGERRFTFILPPESQVRTKSRAKKGK